MFSNQKPRSGGSDPNDRTKVDLIVERLNRAGQAIWMLVVEVKGVGAPSLQTRLLGGSSYFLRRRASKSARFLRSLLAIDITGFPSR